ncbi:hypothetical protein CHS0354_032479 [Potamilus streckersoni]|uniref:Uncharacterized protein n=1 Tax=Potamilus streckersoni TaxID=2493646 RepID=A0AAE0W0N0_9BIVA|nr:hypothetical protein CHS0354_032479 [Potamilus streckersoni]
MAKTVKSKFRGPPLLISSDEERLYSLAQNISHLEAAESQQQLQGNKWGSNHDMMVSNCISTENGITQHLLCRETPQNNTLYGVANLDQIPPAPSEFNVARMNRPNSRAYDYADYGHQYEELPGNRKSIKKYPDSTNDSRSEHQSSGGTTDIQSETDDTVVIVHQQEKRKRVNPLYEAMTQSVPSLYNQVKINQESKLKKEIFCLRLAVITLFFVCCISLAVSCYIIIQAQSQNGENRKEIFTPQMEKLKDNYSHLEGKFSSLQELLFTNTSMDALSLIMNKLSWLENITLANITSLRTELHDVSRQLPFTNERLDTVYQNITHLLSLMDLKIQAQLLNISKMPGPQGPSGVGNLSMCGYRNITQMALASSISSIVMTWQPSIMTLKTEIVMFAACSVAGGTLANLETQAITENLVQYRCVCSGTNSEQYTKCYIHLWTCPRES